VVFQVIEVLTLSSRRRKLAKACSRAVAKVDAIKGRYTVAAKAARAPWQIDGIVLRYQLVSEELRRRIWEVEDTAKRKELMELLRDLYAALGTASDRLRKLNDEEIKTERQYRRALVLAGGFIRLAIFGAVGWVLGTFIGYPTPATVSLVAYGLAGLLLDARDSDRRAVAAIRWLRRRSEARGTCRRKPAAPSHRTRSEPENALN
jgi:hypothetical protein